MPGDCCKTPHLLSKRISVWLSEHRNKVKLLFKELLVSEINFGLYREINAGYDR